MSDLDAVDDHVRTTPEWAFVGILTLAGRFMSSVELCPMVFVRWALVCPAVFGVETTSCQRSIPLHHTLSICLTGSCDSSAATSILR